jgi:hypothetical protein
MFSVMAHFLQILQIRSIFDPAFLDACSYPDSIVGRYKRLHQQKQARTGT